MKKYLSIDLSRYLSISVKRVVMTMIQHFIYKTEDTLDPEYNVIKTMI